MGTEGRSNSSHHRREERDQHQGDDEADYCPKDESEKTHQLTRDGKGSGGAAVLLHTDGNPAPSLERRRADAELWPKAQLDFVSVILALPGYPAVVRGRRFAS